jgi:hypothetical protein
VKFSSFKVVSLWDSDIDSLGILPPLGRPPSPTTLLVLGVDPPPLLSFGVV